MKTVAIVQSCYIPWKGYFDLINSVDEFILYDDCQYTRQDWRNRNRIKTANGTRWLTIPVRIDGLYQQRIDQTEVADANWWSQHWDIIRQAYRTARHFRVFSDSVEAAYQACNGEVLLSDVNRSLLQAVCDLLEIDTALTWSTDYVADGTRTERVVSLCEQAGATVYLSGPRARAYIDDAAFERAGIELSYFDYDGYREYEQVHPPFEHGVTALDLLFNAGPEARSLLKSSRVGLLG